MSKNIVINIYRKEIFSIEDIKLIQDKVIENKKPNNLVYESKYDLEIDAIIITDLPLKSKVRLNESNKIKVFDYNYFIYDNEIYIVYVKATNDNEISFTHPQFADDLSIELNSIQNLCSVKVV